MWSTVEEISYLLNHQTMTHILLNCVVSCFCLVCVTSEEAMEALLGRNLPWQELPFTFEQFYQVKDDHDLINSVLDFVIDDLAVRFENNITVPDHSWTNSLAGLKINLSSGKLKGFSSVKRFGDLQVDVGPTRMKLTLTVTFEELVVAYDKYVAQFLWVFKNSGHLNIFVLDNLVRVTLVMDKKSLCLIDIKNVEILRLENIKLQFNSRCTLCNKLTSNLSTAVLNLFVDSIKSMVQTQINVNIKDFVRAHHGVNLVCLQEKYLKNFRLNKKVQLRPK